MKELFREIMDIEGVKGAMLFSLNGDFVYKEFVDQTPMEVEDKNFWAAAFNSFEGVKECEIVSDTLQAVHQRNNAWLPSDIDGAPCSHRFGQVEL